MKTWNEDFTELKILPVKKNRIIGMTFPRCDLSLGLEPSILYVLPDGDNVEYNMYNEDFNDEDVNYYMCSVYISGMEEFKQWASKHNRNKIIVGGYHPTTFPEDFKQYAFKIVTGLCDDVYETIAQKGQIVNGVLNHNHLPRRDLYNIACNQQVIPDKLPDDLCTSIFTSVGCPNNCDFCCSPIMSNKVVQRTIPEIVNELTYIRQHYYIDVIKYCFIRDENFTLQKDWKKRLQLIHEYMPLTKLYLFASANTLNEETIKEFKRNNVYMVCLGLENINSNYTKNNNLDEVCKLLKKYDIYIYLSFIVNPLEIVGASKGEKFYTRLLKRLNELKPEMICGNFLMPFRGTKLWDEYYQFVSEEDYKYYDSKTPFLVRNKILQEKMKFFMFYYQYIYYTNDSYCRDFTCGDTLYERFKELRKEFSKKYELVYNKRA